MCGFAALGVSAVRGHRLGVDIWANMKGFGVCRAAIESRSAALWSLCGGVARRAREKLGRVEGAFRGGALAWKSDAAGARIGAVGLAFLP